MFPQSAQRCGNAAQKYQKFLLSGKESPSTGPSPSALDRLLKFWRPSYGQVSCISTSNLTWFGAQFLMGTTTSITVQSLEKIVQRAPAVGAKMWCFARVGLPQSVNTAVLLLLTWFAAQVTQLLLRNRALVN